MKEKIVIDATDATLGRLCSFAAKQALMGKFIVIVNCNNAVLTGNKNFLLKEYKEKIARGGSSLKGPFYPKNPQRIVKRVIRGMLPYKQERGRAALKRIICFNDHPKEYESVKKIYAAKEKKVRTTKINDLLKSI